jgi:hypothetical protein
MQITILCPFHATEEKITIPDSYIGDDWQQEDKEVVFEGDVPCNPTKEGRHTTGNLFYGVLHIKVHFQKKRAAWIEKVVQKGSTTIISR